MIPIPNIGNISRIFGNTKHLPAWKDLPEDLRNNWHYQKPHCEFISKWFFKGLTEQDLVRLVPKEGVDKNKALAAIKAILASWQPSHEHKTAGCAFLLQEWFEVK